MPSLPAIHVVHDSSYSPSVVTSLWILTTTLSLSVFPLLALYALKRWDEHLERKGSRTLAGALKGESSEFWTRGPSVDPGDDVVIQWSFPPKEDRSARFKRWAELLRFKPRELRPPIVPLGVPQDFSIDIAIEAFSEVEEREQLKGLEKPKPLLVFPGRPRPVGSLDRYAVLADGVATSLLTRLGRRPCNADNGRHQVTLLKEKVKARILRFLIDCGPPKGLTPITETDIESCPPRDEFDCQEQKSFAGGGSSGKRLWKPGQQRQALASAALLDGEAVMRTRTGRGVSRELLWAAMACIDAPATVYLPEALSHQENEGEQSAGSQGVGNDMEGGRSAAEEPVEKSLPQDEHDALCC